MAFDLLARLRLVDDMSRPLRRATSNMVGFGAKITGVGAALGALTAGVSAVAVASDSIKKAMNFESQISSIQALTGASNEEMAKMQALALKMGASTKYNALEAAQGIEELLKAGLTPATVQAGGLEAALNLATAGGLELADAAEIMSTALNSYKKDGLSAAKASNILAGTANASATGVDELKYALASVSAVASGVGMTFEDTNVALGLFANNGIKGSDAGTSLKTMLSNLQPTTKDQITLFKKLGLMTAKGSNAFYDANGNIKSIDDISGTLRKSLSKLTNQQRSLTLEMIFGSDAVRAGNILYNEGADGVKKFRSEMSKVTALDVAKKKMDNAAGAVEQFKGAIETLQIAALLPTMPIIKDFATMAADAVEKYTPQITEAMSTAMEKLRTFINTNYFENDDFMALNFADKVKVVAADIKGVFDTWWASSGQATFTAVSENITKTLLASLENSVDTITAIGLDIGVGLMSGIVDGMRESKSLGWVFKAQDMFTPEYLKKGWKAIGVDIGTKDAPKGSPVKPPDESDIKRAWETASTPISQRGSTSIMPKLSGGIDRVPKTMPAMLHRDETVLTRGEARIHRNGGSGGGVTINMNGVVVRQDSDINDIATQLYRLINGADNAMGGAGA
ncbi:phage tail tape measure protein [Paenibacillus sp. LPE1-1-1.1]|uniref:phage tail tape measure protein n=1 Tax=Paenibacillus sp. LPE1-1-1.1 TaxID=3135230 RepID=UPI0034255C7D